MNREEEKTVFVWGYFIARGTGKLSEAPDDTIADKSQSEFAKCVFV